MRPGLGVGLQSYGSGNHGFHAMATALGPFVLVHVKRAGSKGDALRREIATRKLGRAGKEALAAEG